MRRPGSQAVRRGAPSVPPSLPSPGGSRAAARFRGCPAQPCGHRKQGHDATLPFALEVGSSMGARCMLGSIQSRLCTLTSASSWSAARGRRRSGPNRSSQSPGLGGGPCLRWPHCTVGSLGSEGSRAHRRVAVATRPARLRRQRRGSRSRAVVGPAQVRTGELGIASRASSFGARRNSDSDRPGRCNLISACGCATGWRRRAGPRRFSQSPRPGRPCLR